MTSSFQIEVDARDVEKTIDTLDKRLEVGVGDWMKDDLRDYLASRARDRFAGEGDDASGAWAPLKPATLMIRANKGFPPAHPINVRTHDLQNWLVGDPGSVVGAGTWIFEWPNTPPSGELFDKLQTAQRGRVLPSTVARPVLAVAAKDYTDIQDSLLNFLVNGL